MKSRLRLCNRDASFTSNVIQSKIGDGQSNGSSDILSHGIPHASSIVNSSDWDWTFQSSPNFVYSMTQMTTAPTLGLSMIVKNEAHNLRQCLESVCGVVSQIVIADTGSTDNSAEIARECGATVISFPWEGHFAKARNAALAPMTTDWVLVLDADEELDASSKSALPALLAAPQIGGYMITIRDYMPEKNSFFLENASKPNTCTHERARTALSYHDQPNIRLFRRHPEVYFYGRVHELVEYRISLLGIKYVAADILIHHFGHLRGNDIRGAKALFYRNLGQLKVKEDADNPFAWFELGVLEYKTFGNLDVALKCFQQTVKLHPPFTRAWIFMAMILLETNKPFDALVALEQAEKKDEAAACRERLKGDAYYNLGQITQSRTAYEKAIQLGETGPLIESRLGLTEVRMGETQTGVARIKKAVNDSPLQTELHDRLVKACVFAQDLPAAADAAERFAGLVNDPRLFLRAAAIRAQLKQWDRSEKIVQRGLQLFPGSADLRSASTEIARLKANSVHQPIAQTAQAGA